ncbi:zona pellucida sperm-binding protein 2-like [Discoglossus pictus]
MEIKLLLRLTWIVGVLASNVWTQQTPSADLLSFTCIRSLAQIYVPAAYTLNNYVTFSAIDEYGRAFEVDDAFATQCGYTVSQDFWGNINFRASVISCYTLIVDESDFTLTVKVAVSPNSDMSGAASYLKKVTCPYNFDARELLCETNYMEVSVRRKIPQFSEAAFQDGPEDWAAAFPDAASGLMSIWQVVFHLQSSRRAMLVRDANNIGYGINTTESRIMLRAPYNASEAQIQNVQGTTFASVRATIFYKQQWLILMVDTAVACPVDDVQYTDKTITWHVPKNIPSLLIGASRIKNSSIEFGVDLKTLANSEISRRNYMVVDNAQGTTVTIPVGAEGGYYKSHVINGDHGITYSIDLFLENEWEDNRWGITRHTIIKEITTPFEVRPPLIRNDTIPSTGIFNVTIGTFLPDVKLVNVTIGPKTVPITDLPKLGYSISQVSYPNGSVTFVLKVPFTDPNVNIQYVSDNIRVYTLNITFGFNIIPSNETFTSPAVITCLVPDAVMPKAIGSCEANYLNLVVVRGNVDQLWLPYIKNLLLTPQSALSSGIQFSENRTHIVIKVPRYSSSVMYEDVSNSSILVTLPLTLQDNSTGRPMSDFSISCSYSPQELIACFPNGTISVTSLKIASVPDMDLSQLVLRDKSCGPVSITDEGATFIFAVNSCGTTRKFNQTFMIYENEVLYFRPGSSRAAYKLQFACQYTINATLVVQYGFDYNPTPSAQTAFGSLALLMSLSKDISYTIFYKDPEYPVVAFLNEPLYFQVELLYSVDPRLELFLEYCWATTSPDRTSFPQWPIVENSCEFKETAMTIFHQVSADNEPYPSHLKRFEVKMFTFMQAISAYMGQIYFHCSVVICNAEQLSSDLLCTKSCIPQRQRLGRSVDSNSMHGYVSSGALLLESESAWTTHPY